MQSRTFPPGLAAVSKSGSLCSSAHLDSEKNAGLAQLSGVRQPRVRSEELGAPSACRGFRGGGKIQSQECCMSYVSVFRDGFVFVKHVLKSCEKPVGIPRVTLARLEGCLSARSSQLSAASVTPGPGPVGGASLRQEICRPVFLGGAPQADRGRQWGINCDVSQEEDKENKYQMEQKQQCGRHRLCRQ